MEDRVNSIETQLALVKQELVLIRGSNGSIPSWLKSASIAMLMAIFAQTITTVWWASEITATQNQIKKEVTTNTDFRIKFPETSQMIMIKLTEIQSENKHMKDMLREVKDKLRYVDITPQVPKAQLEYDTQ